jgi:hypothetical protein
VKVGNGLQWLRTAFKTQISEKTEYRDGRFLRKVGKNLPDYMAFNPDRHNIISLSFILDNFAGVTFIILYFKIIIF